MIAEILQDVSPPLQVFSKGEAIQFATGKYGEHTFLPQEGNDHSPEDHFEFLLRNIYFDLNFLKDPMDYMRSFHEEQVLQVASIDVFLVLTLQVSHYLVIELSFSMILRKKE